METSRWSPTDGVTHALCYFKVLTNIVSGSLSTSDEHDLVGLLFTCQCFHELSHFNVLVVCCTEYHIRHHVIEIVI